MTFEAVAAVQRGRFIWTFAVFAGGGLGCLNWIFVVEDEEPVGSSDGILADDRRR